MTHKSDVGLKFHAFTPLARAAFDKQFILVYDTNSGLIILKSVLIQLCAMGPESAEGGDEKQNFEVRSSICTKRVSRRKVAS